MSLKALVCGAGGFVGGHLVKRLKREGFWVRGVDIKSHPYAASTADDFMLGDLRSQDFVSKVFDQSFDEVYQLAADMGGAGYVFTGENDAEILRNSASINLNVLEAARARGAGRIFFSSSACIYPAENQSDPEKPNCVEDTAYPANPDSDYGWEKLFAERLFSAYQRNFDMTCRIGRYHNIFGPEGTWAGGREKAPAAISRKVAEAPDRGSIEVWGDGRQTRSFLFIDECIEGTLRLMRSSCSDPINIGSERMISITQLAEAVIGISGKRLSIDYVDGPQGVRGRNSDNTRIQSEISWQPADDLEHGLSVTYAWIAQQVALHRTLAA